MTNLGPTYWNNRYKESQTGWDLGKPSLPLTTFIDSLNNKDLDILIPGAGNAYEAIYLWEKGFKNFTILDIAEEPLKQIRYKLPDLPDNQLVQSDFFAYTPRHSLILEQTFFCALAPGLRDNYAKHMHSLLKPNGQLAGVFFDFPLTESGPPFGGDIDAYKQLFSNKFSIRTLERCYNSEPSRNGKELFFIFDKK